MNDQNDPKYPIAKGISPLASPEEQEAYNWQREQQLKQIIEGPSPEEHWQWARQELDQLRYGTRSDEDDWMFGR